MASDISELTVNYEEEGVLVVKELSKEVLSKGTWSTIMFRYQQWDRNKNDYGPILFTIRRYQKRNDEYWQKSKFNISSKEQAQKIVDVLQKWMKEEA
jgi:hypothetical protein